MTTFQIADCPTELTTVEANAGGKAVRQGKIVLTVRNTAESDQTGRLSVISETGEPGWFSIEGAPPTSPGMLERDFAAGSGQTVTVLVNIPPEAAAGTYVFRVRVAAEADPNNDFADGPAVSMVVPPLVVQPPKKPFPWWAVAVAAVLVIAIGVGGWLFLRPSPPQFDDQRGQTQEAAVEALKAAGFKDEDITVDTSTATGKEVGTVYDVKTSDGGFKVTVFVDPGVPVPAIVGEKINDASGMLADSGLVFTLAIVPVNGAREQYVEAVLPDVGQPVQKGSAVAITSYTKPPSNGGGGGGIGWGDICRRIQCELHEFEKLPPNFRRPVLTQGLTPLTNLSNNGEVVRDRIQLNTRILNPGVNSPVILNPVDR